MNRKYETDIHLSHKFVQTANSDKKYFLIKRVMDIVGAICGFIFLSPVFIIIAILIKAGAPKEPVFFKQIRVGKDGKAFEMYKFRSMCCDAEEKIDTLLEYNEIEGPMFKMKDDPRLTKIGRFIRRRSIDEFPQLLNVLKGDMSLVGPRPPLLREVDHYTDYHKKRLSITPGCTGLWQVSGRNRLCFDEMVELDLEYIETVSFLTDAKIIFKTVAVIFWSDDAY